MGELNLMFNLMTNAADSVSQSLQNHAALAEQHSIDQKLRETYESETGNTYNAQNFTRVALDNEEARNTFVAQMETYGIYANSLNEDVRGQYIVEIQNEIDTSTINNPALTTGAGQTVSAQEILENFTQTSGLNFEQVNITPIQESRPIVDNSVQDQSANLFTKHLDTLGHAINLANSFAYMGGDVTADNDIFSRSGLENRSNTGAYLGGDGSMLKTAIVSDGKVYVDGQQIYGCIAENVLKQHERRMNQVEKYANSHPFTRLGIQRQERAAAIKDSLYGTPQEYQITAIQGKNYTNALTSLTNGVNTSSKMGSAFMISLGSNITVNAMALKTDMLAFGISGNSADDIMRFNEMFIKKAEGLGIQFVSGGKFDTDLLNKLTDTQLKKLGISDDSRKALSELNRCGAFRSRSFAMSAAGTAFGLGGRLAGVGADEESQQTLNELSQIRQNAQRGITYSQRAVVSVRRAGRAGREALDAFRVRHMSPERAKAFKEKQKAKAEKAASKKKANAKANEKYTKKLQKKRLKAEKRQNGIIAKISNKFNALKMKIYNNPLVKAMRAVIQKIKAFLVKAAVAAFGGVVAIWFVMMGALVVVALVSSLVDFLKDPLALVDNLLAPEKMSDTALWTLYEFMKGEEDAWIESLNNSIYNITDDYSYLNSDDRYVAGEQNILWGADYQKLPDYVNQFSNLDTNARADLVYGYNGDNLLYINPFDQVGVTASNENFQKYATQVKTFDGTQDVYIGTNMNMFNLREGGDLGIDDDGYFGYSSIQNGHTSNIKDILCMTDVLYETEEDGEIMGITNMSPAGQNWEEVKEDVNNFFGFFKWIGACLSSYVHDHGAPPLASYQENKAVSYQTISNYADTLFQASHQEQYDLKVEYYDTYNLDDKYTEEEGWTQSTLSQIGVCNSPQKSIFKIKFFTDTVAPDYHEIGTLAPYIVKDDGSELRLDKYNSGIRVNDGRGIKINDITGFWNETPHPCLWNYRICSTPTAKILSQEQGDSCQQIIDSAPNCWNKSAETDVGRYNTTTSSTGGDTYYKITGSSWSNYVLGDKVEATNAGGYYDTQSKAQISALSNLGDNKHIIFEDRYANWNNYTLEDYSSYTMTHEYYTESISSAYNLSYTPMTVGTGNYYNAQFAWDTTDFSQILTNVGAGNGDYSITDPTDTTKRGIYYVGAGNGSYKISSGEHGQMYIWQNNDIPDNATPCYYYYDCSKKPDGTNSGFTLSDVSNKSFEWIDSNCKYMYKSNVPDYFYAGASNIFVCTPCDKLVETKTVYKCTGTTNVADYHKDTYTHNCEGHYFNYCGGHVCVRVSGNVFSITNEQIISVGAMDESIIPQALDYVESGGKDLYGDIIGKYDKNEIDYSSAKGADTSVTGVTYAENIYQGSVVGQYGLNLNFDEDDPDIWEDGFEANENFSRVKNQLRDIFDVDCMIDKGLDCFPISSYDEYEGWTADNMSLVILKFSMDWKELYGFDLPLEIGDAIKFPEATAENPNPVVSCDGAGYTLSSNDIDLIVESIKEKRAASGYTVTAKQEEAMRFTLSWVGRGHYNTGHDSHNFLSQTDVGEEYEYRYYVPSLGESVAYEVKGQFFNCSAGSSFEFVNYIMRSVGAIDNSGLFNANLPADYVSRMEKLTNSLSEIEPMTIIMHYPFRTLTHFNQLSVYGSVDSGTETQLASYPDLKERMILYNKPQAIIFLGTLNSEDITLSTGQTLAGDTIVCVDLECINGVGNAWLHNGEEDDDVTDGRLDPNKLYDWIFGAGRDGSVFNGNVVTYYNADDWI